MSGIVAGSTRTASAYNLALEDIHTYHVGQLEILVHNTCAPPWLDELGSQKVTADHTTGLAGKSQFNAGENLFDLAEDSGRFPAVQRADGRCERVCDMGRNIGTDLSGQQTSLMTVITYPNGRVITMHPGMPRY